MEIQKSVWEKTTASPLEVDYWPTVGDNLKSLRSDYEH
jgi:hypothetical protein